MKLEKYNNIISSTDKLEFQFTSEGPKGEIKKVVQFTKTQNDNIYNLAFGNLNKDTSFDDETANDNKDRNKILATIAAIIYEFTAYYSSKMIFFCGSTPARTRLYRMALTINLEELKKDFDIYGVLRGIDSYERLIFKKEVDYYGFIVKRKSFSFTT